MTPLFWTLLILAFFLGICSFFLIWLTNRNKRNRTRAAFEACGASPSVYLNDLWIDPKNHKWAVAKESIDVTVYDYSAIDKVELVQDGETFVEQDGILKTQLGGIVFGMISAATGAGKKKTRMSGNIYIHIYVNGCAFPLESLVLLGTPVKTDSAAFRKKVLEAETLMHTLNAMKNGTYSGENS